MKILNTLDSIVRDSLLTEICFPENGVFRFLAAAFAGMEKWQIQILELSLVNGVSSVTEFVKNFSVFLKLFFILWTPSQFNIRKSKINGH